MELNTSAAKNCDRLARNNAKLQLFYETQLEAPSTVISELMQAVPHKIKVILSFKCLYTRREDKSTAQIICY
jgi:hypothetical protein